MAVIFSDPVLSISGKIRKDTPVSYRTFKGKNISHSYYWNESNVIKPTPARVRQRYAMILTNLLSKQLIATDTVPEEAILLFKKTHQNATSFPHFLNGYIMRRTLALAKAGDPATIQQLIDLAISRNCPKDAELLRTLLPGS